MNSLKLIGLTAASVLHLAPDGAKEARKAYLQNYFGKPIEGAKPHSGVTDDIACLISLLRDLLPNQSIRMNRGWSR